MTANFKEEIGRGGFGAVFLGYLENGSPVAIKMCSKTSQGDKEFSAEVRHSVKLIFCVHLKTEINDLITCFRLNT